VPHRYYVSTTLDGTSGRKPCGNKVDFDYEGLETLGGYDF
jgi:hypothetical protein